MKEPVEPQREVKTRNPYQPPKMVAYGPVFDLTQGTL